MYCKNKISIPAPVVGSSSMCRYDINYEGKEIIDPGILAWSADRNSEIMDVSNLVSAFNNHD